MAGQYIEPQVPLIQGENFYYPLTTAKQVILPDGRRLGGEKLNLTPSDIGVTATVEELNAINNKADINHIQTIEKGGTGATSAEAALTNLGAVAKAGDKMTGKLQLANTSGIYSDDAKWASFCFYDSSGNDRGNMMISSTNQIHFNVKETGNTYAERYRLPDPVAGKTKDDWYTILTSKYAVTVAQGGTGATNAATARNNLGINTTNIGAVPISRTINGKPLDSNITLSAEDVISYGASAKALGTSSPGTASTVSRSDHVHALPALTSCTGTLSIEKGGTGATTNVAACTNLKACYLGSAAEIPSGADLDTYTAAGSYRSKSKDNSASLTNTPYKNSGFHMDVYCTSNDNYIFQEIRTNADACEVYRRKGSVSSNVWTFGSWYQVLQTTTGGLELNDLENVHISTSAPDKPTEGHWYLVKAE